MLWNLFPPSATITVMIGYLFPPSATIIVMIGNLFPPSATLTVTIGNLFPTSATLTVMIWNLFPPSATLSSLSGNLFPPISLQFCRCDTGSSSCATVLSTWRVLCRPCCGCRTGGHASSFITGTVRCLSVT